MFTGKATSAAFKYVSVDHFDMCFSLMISLCTVFIIIWWDRIAKVWDRSALGREIFGA